MPKNLMYLSDRVPKQNYTLRRRDENFLSSSVNKNSSRIIRNIKLPSIQHSKNQQEVVY